MLWAGMTTSGMCLYSQLFGGLRQTRGLGYSIRCLHLAAAVEWHLWAVTEQHFEIVSLLRWQQILLSEWLCGKINPLVYVLFHFLYQKWLLFSFLKCTCRDILTYTYSMRTLCFPWYFVTFVVWVFNFCWGPITVQTFTHSLFFTQFYYF